MKRHLTFANVMVVILTFIVLGGGAYAATQLPKNSVGTKQLKKGAVTKAKIKKSTLKELQGATGPAGSVAGAAGTPPGGTIPSGTTLRGALTAITISPVPGNNADGVGVDFGGFQTPTRPRANLILPGDSATAACPGSPSQPEAASGNLCVYLSLLQPKMKGGITITDPGVPVPPSGLVYSLEEAKATVHGDGTVARFGFSFAISGFENSGAQALGGWAVTG